GRGPYPGRSPPPPAGRGPRRRSSPSGVRSGAGGRGRARTAPGRARRRVSSRRDRRDTEPDRETQPAEKRRLDAVGGEQEGVRRARVGAEVGSLAPADAEQREEPRHRERG